jgi:hypothetical protein
VLQVLNLHVADGVDSDEVAPALVQHLCNQALERGALRLFVRLPDRDPLLPAFRLKGFRQYATEQVVYSENLKRTAAFDAPAGLRQVKGRDKRLLYQLYRKVTPMGVAQIEAPTYKDWRSLGADWTMRPGGSSSEELVVERTEIVAWLKVQLADSPRPHRLSFLSLPEDHLPDHLAAHALNLVAPRGGAAWSSLRHYDSPMLEALRQRGFSVLLTQALMVKELAIRVPLREKAFMPSFG